MTWATVTDVSNLTGKTVTDADVMLAQATIELVTGLIAGSAETTTVVAGGGLVTVTRSGNLVTIDGAYAFGATGAFIILPAWADPAYSTLSESTLERAVPSSLNGGTPVVVFQELAGTVRSTYLTLAEPGPSSLPLRADVTRRDLYWLRQATVFQAAWIADTPDLLERNDVSSASQDGQSVTLKPDALILAPLAKRAIKRLSWRGTRSIRPVPVDALGRVRIPSVYVPLEADDDRQQWSPL